MAKTAVISINELFSTTGKKGVVKEASEKLCLSAEFWVNVKNNLIPHIKENGLMREATYSEWYSLKSQNKIVWMEEKNLEKVNEYLNKIKKLEKEIDGINDDIRKEIGGK
jgi:hypothetical protein